MVSPKQLLSTIESSLLSSTTPTPSQRVELFHAIRQSFPSLKSLLSYPPPRSSDRAEVQSKEVRLPDSSPISLDDQDVQIVLKLSDDLHLNEIDCVRLLLAANQEWGLLGRDAVEILRLAAGLWYSERRDIITALYTLLRAVVLDQGLEADLLADIQKYLEDLICSGLRQRLVSLLKELNREEPAGLGGPQSDHYVLDSRGALVERVGVVCRERLILSHCLVLSVLVVRPSPKDIKDVFSYLRDSATGLDGTNDTLKHQITYSLLFSLVITFISDALAVASDQVSVLSQDASFRLEFQEIVMVPNNDPVVEGFVNCVRFAWAVHLMLIQNGTERGDVVSNASMGDTRNIFSCLEVVFGSNVFHFVLDKILKTAAYQNDNEDIIYMYNAYMHKLITCFLSNPVAMDKVKDAKEKAMTALNPYRMTGSQEYLLESGMHVQDAAERPQPFISMLEFVSEIYQREPELLSGNDSLWTFVNFAGEDHSNFQTLVAFLRMLSTLASNEEGALKVFNLLQGRTFRSIGWSTLFDCLSIYEEKFKQAFQTAGAALPEMQEGDAKALVAYLDVLKKVVENGNPAERKNWFSDIEPLFKLLGFENVPPYLKGALRNAISTFVRVSPSLRDNIWSYLEQYDLPVVVGPNIGSSGQSMTTQVYDMQFELNEIEARKEQYPSTISFVNLLNTLIAEERDVSDRGQRFIGIFLFIYDHVFGPFQQRAYADLSEKWELVIACLQHFRMMLNMYDIEEDDIDTIIDQSQTIAQPSPHQMQLPTIELLKDFMSGKTVFRNIMSIILPGVYSVISERTNQMYGPLQEKAVLLSLEIIILVFEKDLIVSDCWRPLYQSLDVILSHDPNQILALLEYVRYEFHPQIQQCSIKIMSILSSRIVGLVQLLVKSNAASLLIEDYAACLELRSEESQIIENSSDDPGVLILQLLIDNIGRPAPNITHLLLKFDLDIPVERTILQPKFHYSCLKVVLDILEKLSKPEINALLHEFGLHLLYELCTDPFTSGPTLDLLSSKKYHFFVKHLDTLGTAPLPKRSGNQALRISSLHQRAWLLKLLVIDLHAGDMSISCHREACQTILGHAFGHEPILDGNGFDTSKSLVLPIGPDSNVTRTISKSKVLELLEVIQFRCPDTAKYSQMVSNMKYCSMAEDILTNPATSGKGGIYYHSERGDRLIDLAAFRDKLWQKLNSANPTSGSGLELNEVRDAIQQLLRWGWKYNKNLEEQAAQLHMLTGWSQIIEISASRKISLLENRSEIFFQLLDSSLTASASPDCSLKMAAVLTQVALTCMAKLRDERFLYPGGLNSNTITPLDIILTKQLSNGACNSILLKLIMAILRHETSEAIRRRQYALLLSFLQYCEHVLDPDVPLNVVQILFPDDQNSEELDFQKVDKEQAELSRANFSIIKQDTQAILDLVIKDATQGSESGKTIAFYVLDALISIDHEKYFLNLLQSRGFLRSCFLSISNVSFHDGRRSSDSLHRMFSLEAELAFLLRISHKYGKQGAQVLFTMGALEHVGACREINMPIKGSLRNIDAISKRGTSMNFDINRMIIVPILRLVFSLTSLIDVSEFLEVKNKVVREVIDFVKGHQFIFDQVLQEDVSLADELTLEQINLVVGILTKVWPYEESSEYGFVQGLFGMTRALYSHDDSGSLTSFQNQQKSELNIFRLCFSVSSYLYFLVTKKSLRLQVSDDGKNSNTSTRRQQPTLNLLVFFLNSVTEALERAGEEKTILLNKIQDINELSRQEVDEIISTCTKQNSIVPSSDNILKRRYIAMVEMCRITGNRDQLITLLVLLAENILNTVLVHFQDSQLMSGEDEDESLLCGKLVDVLERLEVLSEEKTGQNLKIFRRLASSLKEMAIQKLTL
ncbi:nuclear pore complex protein NUP205 isoform X2 [Impatiens glandulifera]|uniref:nuclear pore complex protein NUP205 isoform X2 n=1 Tax=Impatiens glandulifera TaxID=253017 RepID=UPI001FB173DD|nr:nuclear pore complex protein NUP205 isoform X2 [Impatiens glandulifera]